MKILVTGGAGFIGSNIVDALINEKHSVVVVDNLSNGRKENINKKATFYKTDISDFIKIEKIFLKEKPEIIYHLAAQIDLKKSIQEPNDDAKINILGSINLIDLSWKNKIKKFIFSSSGGAIYGETGNKLAFENSPERPQSPYGIGKLTIDKYLEFYNSAYGLNFASLRYSNVYGPRQNFQGEGGVVAKFISKMLENDQPIINGNGNQTRDYVFVGDVVKANIQALKKINKVGIYNIATGIKKSVNELFDEINIHFNDKFVKKFKKLEIKEVANSCLNFSKAEKDLDWKPQVDFAEGIRKTFIWYKDNSKKIFIVVPGFNEGKVVKKVLLNIRSSGYENIIFIDDCSTDNTYKEAISVEGVIVLRHKINRGQGAALRTGIEGAKMLGANIIVTMDSDGQHNHSEIIKLLRPIIEEQYDIVLGSRLINLSKMPFHKKISNLVGNICTWYLCGLWVTDSQSGFRAYSKKAFNSIDLKSDRYEFASEIIREIYLKKLKYKEISIQTIYTEYSKNKVQKQNFANGLKTLYKLIWRIIS